MGDAFITVFLLFLGFGLSGFVLLLGAGQLVVNVLGLEFLKID